jgi:hypothetical protein
MRLNARDAVLGTSIGSRLWLQHADGRLESYAFGPNREVALVSLPCGQYVARVDAPGISFPQPIALSRDQAVELKVLSERDIIAGFLALAALAVGLLLIGRPRLVAVLGPRAGSLSLGIARFTARGRAIRAIGEEEL